MLFYRRSYKRMAPLTRWSCLISSACLMSLWQESWESCRTSASSLSRMCSRCGFLLMLGSLARISNRGSRYLKLLRLKLCSRSVTTWDKTSSSSSSSRLWTRCFSRLISNFLSHFTRLWLAPMKMALWSSLAAQKLSNRSSSTMIVTWTPT